MDYKKKLIAQNLFEGLLKLMEKEMAMERNKEEVICIVKHEAGRLESVEVFTIDHKEEADKTFIDYIKEMEPDLSEETVQDFLGDGYFEKHYPHHVEIHYHSTYTNPKK